MYLCNKRFKNLQKVQTRMVAFIRGATKLVELLNVRIIETGIFEIFEELVRIF